MRAGNPTLDRCMTARAQEFQKAEATRQKPISANDTTSSNKTTSVNNETGGGGGGGVRENPPSTSNDEGSAWLRDRSQR